MQNVFLSMTFLLTGLSRCYTSCKSKCIPWILLTQLDLVLKVLKVLVFMSNSQPYPRGWTPAWVICCDCLYGKSHPGEEKTRRLPPLPDHKRTTSSHTRWSVPLICHPWDRHFSDGLIHPFLTQEAEKFTSDKATCLPHWWENLSAGHFCLSACPSLPFLPIPFPAQTALFTFPEV